MKRLDGRRARRSAPFAASRAWSTIGLGAPTGTVAVERERRRHEHAVDGRRRERRPARRRSTAAAEGQAAGSGARRDRARSTRRRPGRASLRGVVVGAVSVGPGQGAARRAVRRRHGQRSPATTLLTAALDSSAEGHRDRVARDDQRARGGQRREAPLRADAGNEDRGRRPGWCAAMNGASSRPRVGGDVVAPEGVGLALERVDVGAVVGQRTAVRHVARRQGERADGRSDRSPACWRRCCSGREFFLPSPLRA